jgi:hypothetical protein
MRRQMPYAAPTREHSSSSSSSSSSNSSGRSSSSRNLMSLSFCQTANRNSRVRSQMRWLSWGCGWRRRPPHVLQMPGPWQARLCSCSMHSRPLGSQARGGRSAN